MLLRLLPSFANHMQELDARADVIENVPPNLVNLCHRIHRHLPDIDTAGLFSARKLDCLDALVLKQYDDKDRHCRDALKALARRHAPCWRVHIDFGMLLRDCAAGLCTMVRYFDYDVGYRCIRGLSGQEMKTGRPARQRYPKDIKWLLVSLCTEYSQLRRGDQGQGVGVEYGGERISQGDQGDGNGIGEMSQGGESDGG